MNPLALTTERTSAGYVLRDGVTEVALVRAMPGEFPFDTEARARALAELISEGFNARYAEQDDGK